MLFGHRGANQPVVDLQTKRVYMSSQNHSYEVDEPSLRWEHHLKYVLKM